MNIFKDFPVKELFLRLLLIIIVVFTFKGLATRTIFTKAEKRSSKQPVQQVKNKILQANRSQEKLLALVDKLNAHIDAQAFLLSNLEKNDLCFEEMIQIIADRLDDIEKEARKKRVSKLIDRTQIDEIKSNIRSYEQALLNPNPSKFCRTLSK
jgi:hypothetical protein